MRQGNLESVAAARRFMLLMLVVTAVVTCASGWRWMAFLIAGASIAAYVFSTRRIQRRRSDAEVG
jgi:Flp pilus assembly protein TadB